MSQPATPGAATPPAPAATAAAWRVAALALAGLIALGVAWELWLAPLRPGGSWLVLKVVPLVLLVPGVLRREPAVLQWALLATPLVLGEGAVRLFESPPAARCAALELALGLAFFAAAVVVLRPLKRAARQRAAQRRAAGTLARAATPPR
jgi:uncharacterized membrane protein